MTQTRVLLLIACATLALFAFACWHAPLQNEDSVLYLVLADRISAQGLPSAFDLYDRPFYSAMIAGLHAGTGLATAHAAQVLNAGCAAVLVCSFALFCARLHRDDRLLPWAALVLLAHPKFVNNLSLLLRDTGYWALLLLSFCMLLRHAEQRRPAGLVGWAACILGAALFKPEALVWGLLVPPGMLLAGAGPVGRRLRDAALGLVLVAVPAIAGSLLFSRYLGGAGTLAPEPLAVPQQLAAAITDGFGAAVSRYADSVLAPSSRHVAAISLAGGLLVLLVAKVLNALGPLQLGLLVWGRAAAPAPNGPVRRLLAVLLSIALLLPAVFVAYRQFLDTRYVMPVVFLLLALIVPSVRALAQRIGSLWRGKGGAALVLVAALFAVDLALGLDRPKPYMLDCVDWMRAELRPGTRLFSNDVQLAAASGARWDWDEARHAGEWLATGWRPYQAEVVVLHERNDRVALPELQSGMWVRLQEIKRFESGNGARIRVLVPERLRLP